MQKIDKVREWFQRIWVEGDLTAIEGFFTPQPTVSGVMAELDLRPEDFSALVPALRMMMVHPEIEVARSFESGDWLWALITVRAQSARDGAQIAFSGQLALRFEGERFAEVFNHFDFITFAEQIGALPAETMALCLTGEVLTL